MQKLMLLFIIVFFPGAAIAQTPEILDDDIEIRSVLSVPSESVKLAWNAADQTLYMVTVGGTLYAIDIENGTRNVVQTSADHGLENVQGLDTSGDGRFFLVGNEADFDAATNVATIKRAEVTDGSWQWTTVAETEPYALSNTDFDHVMNEIVVSPDDEYLFINSGSRTDHGEVQSADGQFPGLREEALTAIILRLPTNASDILLENDKAFLNANGYIFAEGTRNSFGLAFNAEGELFGTDNSGERDDPEGFKWLREGRHYGFPWRMGGNDTPMQFPDYDPDEDLLISTDARDDIFYNDPDYPAPPEGITFTEPILNHGPDGVKYRDPTDGQIYDAAEQDTVIASFTGHRSSLGLVFDAGENMTGSYTGGGFALAFTGGNDPFFLLQHMDDEGEDLSHIELVNTDDGYEMKTTTVAKGFLNPIDAEIIENKIYVIELRNDSWLNVGADTKLWELSFPGTATAIEEPEDELAAGFELHQNYPNPFNPSTQIDYALPEAAEVRLEVFNMMGQRVATLVDARQNAGNYSMNFSAENLASGIYLYRLTAGPEVITQKMTLLK